MRWLPALLVPLLASVAADLAAATARQQPARAAAVQDSETPTAPVGRAWLGVWLGDAVDGGVRIVETVRGGPAHLAGVQAGDTIVEANSRAVTDQVGLGRVLDTLQPGDRLQVLCLRSGQAVELEIHLGNAGPSRAAVRSTAPRSEARGVAQLARAQAWRKGFGLQTAPITPELRSHLGAPRDAGVLVISIESEGLADRAGVRVGDVLVRLEGREVTTPEQLLGSLYAWTWQRSLELVVVRGGERDALRIAPPEDENRSRGRSVGYHQVAAARELGRQEQVQRRFEAEIEQLERRLEKLKRELREFKKKN